jgi:hypothetical protein
MARLWRSAAAVGLVFLAVSSTVPSVDGAQPSRAEFVADAERICEVPVRKGLRLLYRGLSLEEDGAYVRAGKKVVRAGRLWLTMNRRLGKLEPPASDARLIEVWLTDSRRGFTNVVAGGKALKAKRLERSDRLLGRANRTVRRANEKVRPLGFDHCV